ncbi:MAG: JAB domain-containing protein [candidate division WOR-3 bacterium]
MFLRKKLFSTENVVKEFWKEYQKLPLPDRRKEHLWIMLLDFDFSVIGIFLIRTVTPESNEIKLKEVFSYPLYFNAPFFILCHNHPSNWVEFSKEDKEFTKNVKEWAEKLGFGFLDHIILTESGYYSSLRKKLKPKKEIKFIPFRPHMTNLKSASNILKGLLSKLK